MELVKKNNDPDKDITEDDIVSYLKNHPGFFLKRDDLVLELQLAHPSGKAVSLLERQVSLLRERNMDIRNRLKSLLDNAGNNDKLFEKTQQLVLALIEAQGPDAIVNAFNRSMISEFKMDFSSIILFGNPAQYRSVQSRMVSVDEAFDKIPGLLKSNNATCGVLRDEEAQFLFSGQHTQVKSAAVIALSHNEPLGVIAIGSKDANYFRPDIGTVFVGYIAEVLNRLLPRHLNK